MVSTIASYFDRDPLGCKQVDLAEQVEKWRAARPRLENQHGPRSRAPKPINPATLDLFKELQEDGAFNH